MAFYQTQYLAVQEMSHIYLSMRLRNVLDLVQYAKYNTAQCQDSPRQLSDRWAGASAKAFGRILSTSVLIK